MKTLIGTKKIAVGLLAALAFAQAAFAQDYPSRRVTLLCGFAAGGPADIAARLIADKLKDALGQPVIVENRLGGGPILSWESTKTAPPDGYLLSLATFGIVSLKFTSKAYALDPLKDLTYIGQTMTNAQPQILVASTNAPYKTPAEFVAFARANPGKINFGTIGTTAAIEISSLMHVAGFKVTTVPYNGSAQIEQALAAGSLDATITTYQSSKPNIDSGRTRIVGVGSRVRAPEFPNVPAISEAVPGFEMGTFWYGIVGPANMPTDLVNRLNQAINAAMRQPDMDTRLSAMGLKTATGSPAEFRAFAAREYERFAKAYGLLGVQPQ